MQVYLLSIKALLYKPEDEAPDAVCAVRLRQHALKMLDKHRLEKVRKINAQTAQSQSIGAGLLLQFAVQMKSKNKEELVVLSVSEVLEKIEDAVSIDYTYDVYGKPDFAEGNWHFSLSHSGEYVCLVTDESPVGVDIQQMRSLKNYHLAERYFSEKEFSKLEACLDETEKEECFYDIWVKKESYAKLTGKGIGQTVDLDTEDASLPVCWREFDGPEGYRLAVCTADYQRENGRTVKKL